MDITTLTSTLNIKLGDTDNFAFTSDEKTRIVTEAIQDPYTVSIVTDTSLVYSTNTWEYTIPSTLTTVTEIKIQADSTQDPETIALPWEVSEGKLRFKGGSGVIPDASTLYLKGHYKYDITDTITEIRVQDYVLNLAQLNALDQLGVKKTMRFLKNDISVSEIIAIKRELERKVGQHRASLQRAFQVV